MRIGILTLPLEVNYGGILQAFALQKTLVKMGFDVVTIDRHNRREYPSIWKHIAGYLKRNFQHYMLNKDICTKWNPFISDEVFLILSSNTQKFINRNIRLTKRVYSDELKKIDEEYKFDAYVVGSDQVWLDYYCPDSFLTFVDRPNVLKVVYAASCNERNSFFNKASKVRLCRRLVKNFQGTSVREKFLVPKCQERLGIEAEWVLDPTMLLAPEEYLEVIDSKEGYDPVVFSYLLDDTPSKRIIVDSIAKKLGIPCVDGNIKGKVDGYVRKVQPYPSVDDWLHNLHRSRFVVTDSFHGTVFSILFNKPFVTIGNARRGLNRFKSLLELFGLESRMIQEEEFSKIWDIVDEEVIFASVNDCLNKWREKSLSFIKKNLIIRP